MRGNIQIYALWAFACIRYHALTQGLQLSTTTHRVLPCKKSV